MGTSAAAQPAPTSRWPAALAWALAGLAGLALAPGFRLAQLMGASGLPDAQAANAATSAVLLATVSAAAVGALLASSRPRHPVGWLLLGVGLGLAMNILVEAYVKYGLLVRPGRWWGGSAAPRGPNACSFAGWRWRQRARRCCCRSPWSPGTWGRTPWCWRR